MISKNQTKQLRALQRKKERRERGQFLLEGEKSVLELLTASPSVQAHWPLVHLFASSAFLKQHAKKLTQWQDRITSANTEELTRNGTLAHNHSALAIVKQAPEHLLTWQQGEWLLLLDQVQDPGNLGSLLRIADWYGINKVVCAPETAELYNPKTLAASKGSFLRVQVSYQALEQWLAQLPLTSECLGAFLEGESIHQLQLPTSGQGGVLVLGSEAQGISQAVAALIRRRVTIPAFGQAESLNVGMAAAVLCDNLRRLQGLT